MTDTAELKPVAWRARRYGSSEWEVFGYDPRALKQFSFFEPLYSADALTSPASGSVQPRSFWMHYDHQAGHWIVDDYPPKVVRTGSEVIHVLEVLPTSPASGERDAVIEECAKVVEAEELTGDAPAHFTQHEIDIVTATVRSTARSIAAAIRALRMEGK